jgi:uncharacterized protein YfaS (alpha-2-macroglobulin family)
VVVRRFAGLYPASAIAGTTRVTLGGAGAAVSWPIAADAPPLTLPLKTAGTLTLAHDGSGTPWATIAVRAAVPLRAPINAGYRIERSVTMVKAAAKDRLTRGDVVKVRLTVTATAGRSWVVIADPVPPGAVIVGNLGGQSALLAAEAGGEGAQPSYVERAKVGWRGYFAWLPQGTHSVEYVVRLNSSGRFTLPPTRVEAMYSPAVNGQYPNGAVTIAAGDGR